MSGLTVVIGGGSRALYPKILTLRLRCSCFCETSRGGELIMRKGEGL